MSQSSFQPLRAGAIVNRGGTLFRQHLKPMLLLSLLTYAPIAILGVALQMEMIPLGAGVENGQIVVATQEQLDRLGLANLITGLITLVGFLFSMASLHVALSDAYAGHEVDWRASFRSGLAKMGQVLVVVVAIAALAIAPFILLVAVSGAPEGFVVLMMLAAIVWAGVVLLTTSLSIPVLMREDISAVSALRRSKELMSGHILRGLWIFFLAAVIVGVFDAIVGRGLGAAFTANARTPDALLGGASAGLIVATIITTPLLVAIVTVFYFDLRARKEEYGPADFDRESGKVTAGQGGVPMPTRTVPTAESTPASVPATRVATARDVPVPRPVHPTAPPAPVGVRGPRWSEPLPDQEALNRPR